MSSPREHTVNSLAGRIIENDFQMQYAPGTPEIQA
jgi:hypothetical protein